MMKEKHQKLIILLEEQFDETDLKRIAFFILGPGSYDDLRGESKRGKALSLIEHLNFRKKTDKLIDYIREFRGDIDLTDFEIEPLDKKSTQIEFVNRVSEIQYITNPFCTPYLLISAPAGYGKTKLLEVLKTQFQGQGWLCIYAKLTRGQPYSVADLANNILRQIDDRLPGNLGLLSPAEYGGEIAVYVLEYFTKVQANGILLLLDEVEAFQIETVKQVLDEFIPALNEGLRAAGQFDVLRVILAGRYIAKWEQLINKLPLGTISMTPFNFPVVQQTVAQFAANSQIALAPEAKQGIASHLMYLTGGHPGCMAQILKDYRPGLAPDHFLLNARGDKHYQEKICPVVNDIRNYIPAELQDIFDTLSVIRRFNSRLLRHLINTNLIRWPKSEHKLADALTSTYLVTREDGFLRDGITRRLLAMRLRKTNPEHFIRVCKEALNFYEQSLEDSAATRPDIIAIESLFQKLHYLHYKQVGGKQEILDSLPELLQKLMSGRDASSIIQSFVDLVRKDWELQFNFNYLLRDRIYSHDYPYAELIQQISDLEAKLQGENHV